MFRSHGTDAAREIWRFGEAGNPFYDTIARTIHLRYRLMPYIYSLAGQVTLNSYTLLRAVALDYPADAATHNLTDQFLFGPALLVCPVTTPMYYGRHSTPLTGVAKTRVVYLPGGNDWFDFWTGVKHAGGATITADAPLEKIPLLVRAGSIIPLGPPIQYTGEKPADPLELRVYRGADGAFTLYEDEGDNYNYEHGAFATIRFAWDDRARTLTIAARQGSFPGMLQERTIRIVDVSAEAGGGIEAAIKAVELRYTGLELSVRL
jgi:alpha-D-xyloside xylohydrolase